MKLSPDLLFSLCGALSLVVFFAACGDDSSEKIAKVDEASSVAFSCAAEELANKSGVKIVCNGDSVGVVLNGATGKDGKDGADGKDGKSGTNGKNGTNGKPGAGCTVSQTAVDTVLVTCGADSVVLPIYVPENSSSSQDVLDSEQIAVSLDSISGVTQKGPFLSGSKVTLYELEDGRSLNQTGNTFNGKILNDEGLFRFNSRSLPSQYVMLEAKGFYRNEVTGENSNAELKLYAVTNVLLRRMANINLLTHLEYERVIHLVKKEKYTVRRAKIQAQKEIFALLDIDASNFSSSEDLSIAGSSDEDGALLAFSVLLQGDRTVAELSELLTKIASDMEKDGKWNDSVTRMQIADWAADADVHGRLDSVRKHVEGWHLSLVVPKFEPYVRHFWYKMYGLDSCNANNVGEIVKAAAGANKDNDVRYICRENGLWGLASDLEKDTYKWEAGTDGEVKKGIFSDSAYYVYDAMENGWRVASVDEKALLLGCTSRIRDTVVAGVENYYVCERKAGFSHREDCSSKKNCPDVGYTWSSPFANRVLESMYPGCLDDNHGKIQLPELPDDTRCVVTYVWNSVASNYVAENTHNKICTEKRDAQMRVGLIDKNSYFVCDSFRWRDATTIEEKLKEACSVSRRDSLAKDTALVCDEYGWREASFYDYPKAYFFESEDSYDSLLTDTRDGRKYRVITIGNQQWMAENLNFNDSSNNLMYNTLCYGHETHTGGEHEENCEKGGRLYSWTAAMNINDKWYKVSATAAGKIKSPHQGICPEGWHIPDSREWIELFQCEDGLNCDADWNAFKAKNLPEWKGGTNVTKFTAYPTWTGSIGYGMGTASEKETACWWTTDENDGYETKAYNAYIGTNRGGVDSSKEKTDGCAVRCVRNLAE